MCGPHVASAVTAAEHTFVEEEICDHMPMACLCNARTLRVSNNDGKAMQCGEAQPSRGLMRPPTVLPPAGVTLDQVRRIQSAV